MRFKKHYLGINTIKRGIKMGFLSLLNEGSIESIESAFGKKFVEFVVLLTTYIDYNVKEEKAKIVKFKKELKKCGCLENKVSFRLVKSNDMAIYKINQSNAKSVTSASTAKLKGDILELMKNMITTFKPKGNFYYLEVDKADGIDINKFGEEFLKNKDYLIEKYDGESKPMQFFFETLDAKKEQIEYLILGKYKVKKFTKI